MDANMWNLLQNSLGLTESLVNRNLFEPSVVNRGVPDQSLSMVNRGLSDQALSMVNRGRANQAISEQALSVVSRGLSGQGGVSLNLPEQALSMMNRGQVPVSNRTLPEQALNQGLNQALYLMNHGLIDESLSGINRGSDQPVTNIPAFLDPGSCQQLPAASTYLPYAMGAPQFTESATSYSGQNGTDFAQFSSAGSAIHSSVPTVYQDQSQGLSECRYVPPAHSNRASSHSSHGQHPHVASMYPLNLSSTAQTSSAASPSTLHQTQTRQPVFPGPPPQVSNNLMGSDLFQRLESKSTGSSKSKTSLPSLISGAAAMPRLSQYSMISQTGLRNSEYRQTTQSSQASYYSNMGQSPNQRETSTPLVENYNYVPQTQATVTTSIEHYQNLHQPRPLPSVIDPRLTQLPTVVQAQADSTTKKGLKTKQNKPKQRKKTAESEEFKEMSPPKSPNVSCQGYQGYNFNPTDSQPQYTGMWGTHMLGVQAAYETALAGRQLTELQSVSTNLDAKSYLKSSVMASTYDQLLSPNLFSPITSEFGGTYSTVDSSCLQSEPETPHEPSPKRSPEEIDPEFQHLTEPLEAPVIHMQLQAGVTAGTFQVSEEDVKLEDCSRSNAPQNARNFQNSFLSFLQGNKGETLSSVSNSTITKKPELPKYDPELSSLPIRKSLNPVPTTSELRSSLYTKPPPKTCFSSKSNKSNDTDVHQGKPASLTPPGVGHKSTSPKKGRSSTPRKRTCEDIEEVDISGDSSAAVTIQKVQLTKSSPSLPHGGSVTRLTDTKNDNGGKPPITLKINLTKLPPQHSTSPPLKASRSHSKKKGR